MRLGAAPGGLGDGAIGFNVLSRIDLVTAVILGVLAAPGLLQLQQVTVGADPTVVVAICIALHILSLRRLFASDLARQRRKPW